VIAVCADLRPQSSLDRSPRSPTADFVSLAIKPEGLQLGVQLATGRRGLPPQRTSDVPPAPCGGERRPQCGQAAANVLDERSRRTEVNGNLTPLHPAHQAVIRAESPAVAMPKSRHDSPLPLQDLAVASQKGFDGRTALVNNFVVFHCGDS